MKSKIKLCIFDMDGTLIDTESKVWLVGKEIVLKQFNKEFDIEYFKSITGIGFRRFAQELKNHFGEDFDADLYQKKLYEYYENVVHTTGVPLKKGGKELLDYLKANNIKIALGTSTERYHVELILNKLGIMDYFDSIVCGDEVKLDKPNPEIFEKSQIKLGINKDECLVLEDSINGLATAKNASMRCIIIKDIYPYKEHDLDGADFILDDMNQVIPIIEKINYGQEN